jgi:hypothetical protein
MRLLIIALVIAAISAGATYVLTDPRSNLDDARGAILNEYLLTYCRYDPRHSPEYHAAKTALLSRLTIKAGIGEIALAEYAKCKIWVQ